MVARAGANRFQGDAAFRRPQRLARAGAGAEAPPEFRGPEIHLWLGRDAHIVHYPVKAGAVINVVVIVDDAWNAPGWSVQANRIDLLPRLPAARWAPQLRALVRQPETLDEMGSVRSRAAVDFAHGAVALLGDAAHPMLPFLAQGAAMAIEDAAVAASCLARRPDDAAAALKTYAAVRRARTRKVQRLAARNGTRYHRSVLPAVLRNAAMRAIGGERLLRHYDWLYDWRPPAALSK